MLPSGLLPRGSLQCLIVLSAIGTVNATCYYPNGTDRNRGFPSDTYFPINPGDDFSMCCSRLGDKPRSDGLCANSDGSVIWRESCTDRTWQSPKCIKLCAGTDPDTNDSPGSGRQMDNDEQVTPCSDGSYCCGDGGLGSSCCNEGRGVFVRDGTTQNNNPTATPTSSTTSETLPTTANTLPVTAAISAGPTADAAPTPASSSQDSGVNTGAIAGGLVGGLAGLLIIVLALWFFYRRRKANKTAQSSTTQQHEYPPTSEAQDSTYGYYKSPGPQEAQGSYIEEYKRPELQAGAVSPTVGRAELDTQHISPQHRVQSS
ncbi:MAG: hypothetical protein LQ348_002535 [Seirophora lacunosa]|nr:MAG: hypothetical protein LQ348_002535 [Seirophora lacunosa]